jgi:hypothetical protein
MKPHWYRTWATRLRAQPPEVKSHIAFVAAGVATTLVALVWVTTLPARFATIGTLDNTVASSTELMMDTFTPLLSPPSPTEGASSGVPDTADELRDRIGDFRRDREVHEGEADTDVWPATGQPKDTSTIGQPVLIEVR